MTATDRIVEFFAAERFATIQAAESGTSHRIVYADDEASGRLGGYRTGGTAAPLDSDQIAQLQSALRDDTLYEFELVKRVPFRPDHGIELHAGERSAIVLLDSSSTKLGWTEGQEVSSVDVHTSSAAYATVLDLLTNP